MTLKKHQKMARDLYHIHLGMSVEEAEHATRQLDLRASSKSRVSQVKTSNVLPRQIRTVRVR